MKKLSTFIAAGLMTAAMAVSAFAGTWKQDNTGWWYQNDNGSFPVNQWAQINGSWYYFDASGVCLNP